MTNKKKKTKGKKKFKHIFTTEFKANEKKKNLKIGKIPCFYL